MAEVDVTRIAGNIGAMNALNSLNNINKQLSIHQTRLATGKRINSAADDPAGLTIATKMLSRSEGLKTALSNIGDTKNLLAVAESGMGRINDILVQMRNKAEVGASDTMSTTERDAIKTQLLAYAQQINDIADQTKWNDKKLIDGSISGGANALRFQTGADSVDATTLDRISDLHASGSVLNIATSAAENTASSAATDFTVDAGSGVPVFNGMDALSTGSYKVVYSYDATSEKLDLQLQDGSGNAVAIDANQTNETGAQITANSLSISWDAAADKTVDLGNGMSLTFDKDAFLANKSSNAAVSFTQKGTLGLTLTGSTATDYANYMDTIQSAIGFVNTEMSGIGALTGRLTFKEDQVSAAQINVEAAYNRIMNANMAEEQVNSSKYQILQQTATAMLAQANAAPQFLLSLFR